MKVIDFYVSNFKGLKEVRLENLEGLNVIVGYNGNGKTNLLSALYMFMKNLDSGIEKKTFDDNNQEHILLWKDYDITNPIQMNGKLMFPRAEAERIAGFREDIVVDVTNRISYANNAVTWDLSELMVNGRSLSRDNLEGVRKLFTYASGQIEYIPIFDQAYFEKTMREMAELNRSPINLRKYWYDFVNLTAKVIPEIKGLEFWEFKKLVLNVYNTPIYIDLAASGFQKIILMLFKLWMSPNKLLLVEEPEVNMHPLLQMKFIKLIRTWANEGILQVFMSTHSPYLTSLENKKYIIMRRKGNSSEAIYVDIDDEMKSAISLLGVELGDLLFSKIIVLTGETVEPPVVDSWLSKVGVDTGVAGIKVFKVRGDLDLGLWLKLREKLSLRILFLGLCEKLFDGVKDYCVGFNREVEYYYDRNIVLNVLKDIGIYPDEKELRDLGKDDMSKWIASVLKKRGYEYNVFREQIGKLVVSKDSIEVPREIEVLANKIKTVEA